MITRVSIIVAGTQRLIGELVSGPIEDVLDAVIADAGAGQSDLLTFWPMQSLLLEGRTLHALETSPTIIPCVTPRIARFASRLPRIAFDLTNAMPQDIRRLPLTHEGPSLALMPYHAFPSLNSAVIGASRQRPLLPVVYDVPGDGAMQFIAKAGVFAYGLAGNGGAPA